MEKNKRTVAQDLKALQCTILSLYYHDVFTDLEEAALAKKAAETNKTEDWINAITACYNHLDDALEHNLEELKQALIDNVVPDDLILSTLYRGFAKTISTAELFACAPMYASNKYMVDALAQTFLMGLAKEHNARLKPLALYIKDCLEAAMSNGDEDIQVKYDVRKFLNILYPNMSEKMKDAVLDYREENATKTIKLV